MEEDRSPRQAVARTDGKGRASEALAEAIRDMRQRLLPSVRKRRIRIEERAKRSAERSAQLAAAVEEIAAQAPPVEI